MTFGGVLPPHVTMTWKKGSIRTSSKKILGTSDEDVRNF